MSNSKFGFHVLWIVPYCLTVDLAQYIVDKYRAFNHSRRIKRILKQNPDISRLTKLADINFIKKVK